MLFKYRTVLYLLACLFCCGRAWAQEQQHYVYIQSEKGQPFYVKVNGQVLSSTERGYVILPRLESGTVPISIGFAKSEGPSQEQKFHVRIAQSDLGFLLKKSSGSGYALYNMQTFRETKADNNDGGAVAAAAKEPALEAAVNNAPEDTTHKEMMNNMQKDLETTFSQTATVTGPAKSSSKPGNSFSSALDKVVVSGDDRDEPVAEEAPAKPAPAPAPEPAAEHETKKHKGKKHKGEREPLSEEEEGILKQVMAEESRTAASEAATEDLPKTEGEEQPAHKKQKKHKKREGDPDFIEFQDDSKSAAPAPAAPAVVAAVPVETPAPAVETPVAEETPAHTKKKKRKLFDDTEHPANIVTDSSGYGIAVADDMPSKKRKKTEDVAVVEATPREKVDTRLVNTDCGNIMDEGTFRKVLRKFVAAKSDDAMIDVFRRATRNYCLETTQVKTMVQLLTADEARYRLLDMAYAKTYDTEKYNSLESLLTESYYKGRFKAMLHK
ncbi:DUF4476 domain-containing protein [Chitinophaga sp. HK235]|uniref:DUF4476 domain-containing protein n=1 Tax=Chitinophaga sp. HK235 TaxID=2952571 RepID=UPI001BA9CA86|nr:DUF4476 domain-containing protein [Chitinophaga sp. HK235]